MADTEHIEKIRHSLAHLLAIAVCERYPDTKLAIGPATDTGFYYDFEFTDKAPDTDALDGIAARMRELIAADLPFTRIESDADDARKRFADQPYKLELIDDLERDGADITLYKTGVPAEASAKAGDFIDLCRGGHIEHTNEIDPDAFTIERVAGAYWRGDEQNTMLTRIYGAAFETPEDLEKYTTMRAEAAARDHKKLGRDLDLFYIDEKVGKGLPMWTPKGTAMKHELETFTRELERSYGYEHVETPYLGKQELYETSGHLTHYAENMYAPIDMDGDVFYLRPMACPHHVRLLQRKPITYRDLPIRYAEIADYNRYEKSGELMGMIRVRKFQLTDAHIFVAPDGLKEEFKNVCRLIREGMEGIGLAETVTYRFSKRDPHNPEKYHQDDALWDHAEAEMRAALDEIGFTYVEAEDEAAFYGPKLDVQAKNVNGKEDTLFTAQIDFLLPEKFDVTYTDSDGSKKRPVMIHRSAIGSLERTFAFLIEHYAGKFPLWLSPVHVAVLPIGDAQQEYAQTVTTQLRAAGMRVSCDTSNETLGKKIRHAKTEKIPYIFVLGDTEMQNGTATVEHRDAGKLGELSIADSISKLSEEIQTRA